MHPSEPAATFLSRRRRLLSEATRRAGRRVDAAFITKTADIRYLCGSTEGGSGLYLDRFRAVVFTHPMFAVLVTQEAPGCEVRLPKAGLHAELATLVHQRRRHVLGLREEDLSVPQERTLRQALGGLETCDIGPAINACRACKDAGEIALTRRAVAVAEDAFQTLTARGAAYFVGRTERQLAAELDYLMRLGGADASAFATIVAAGPNSYSCHHVPGDRVVGPREPVLFDWGAEIAGYRSDITRVVFAEGVEEPIASIYRLVLAAHEAAVAKMGPGVRGYTVNAAARGLIERAGYGDEFRHGLGHGIGLEIHEPPVFAARPAQGTGTILKPGMILTIEPGIYLEGIGGVRIEDDILMTPHGYERLNRLPRNLDAMILY